MSKFGFVGPSYTARSSVAADEECINWYAETNETPGAQSQRSYFGTPGLSVAIAFPDGPERGNIPANGRVFTVSADVLYEVYPDLTYTARGNVDTDGNPVSMAYSTIQLLIVSAQRAFCYDLATNTMTEVTALLAGAPIQVKFDDSYFVVTFVGSNKFQSSDILDGTVWPGIQVNEVSVFPENIVSIEASHRELWVFGSRHAQPYQDTGSDEIFDPIPGTLIEMGSGATFGVSLLDNTVFWVSEDDRGGRMCWRGNGYTPSRISTHAVENALSSYSTDQIANLAAYTYQQGGHLFWQLYIPGTDCSWVYDVSESMWHKRAEWLAESATFGPHRSWNHVYAFGKHLVGDWKTGNLYELSLNNYDDFGNLIRRVRRTPTLSNEMNITRFSELRVQFDSGQGPQPPLVDGDGNPRPPQTMLRMSNDHGTTWGNELIRDCGYAGEYSKLVRWQRVGQTRYGRVYELSVSDPVFWAITDAYTR